MNKEFSTSEQYVAIGGSHCPNCGSENIEGGSNSDTDGDWCSKDVRCLDCKATWDDIFTLSGYDNLQVPKEAA